MAVHNRSSANITNRDATPSAFNDPGLAGAFLRFFRALVLSVTSDSATSVYRFFTLPSNAIVKSIALACQAQGAGAVFDIGLYSTVADGGAVILDNAFASGVDVSGAIALTDERFNALALATAEQQLWQLAGLSADPGGFMDVCITVDVAVASGGNIILDATVTY